MQIDKQINAFQLSRCAEEFYKRLAVSFSLTMNGGSPKPHGRMQCLPSTCNAMFTGGHVLHNASALDVVASRVHIAPLWKSSILLPLRFRPGQSGLGRNERRRVVAACSQLAVCRSYRLMSHG